MLSHHNGFIAYFKRAVANVCALLSHSSTSFKGEMLMCRLFQSNHICVNTSLRSMMKKKIFSAERPIYELIIKPRVIHMDRRVKASSFHAYQRAFTIRPLIALMGDAVFAYGFKNETCKMVYL